MESDQRIVPYVSIGLKERSTGRIVYRTRVEYTREEYLDAAPILNGLIFRALAPVSRYEEVIVGQWSRSPEGLFDAQRDLDCAAGGGSASRTLRNNIQRSLTTSGR